MDGTEETDVSGEVVEDSGAAFSFSQAGSSNIPRTWILLDNQSTVDVICNKDLLSNIRTIDNRMRIKCNAGYRITQQVGDLAGYGRVWFDPHGMANILSLHLAVKRNWHVKYDSKQADGAFVVTKPDGKVFKFVRSESGLHYLDTA